LHAVISVYTEHRKSLDRWYEKYDRS